MTNRKRTRESPEPEDDLDSSFISQSQESFTPVYAENDEELESMVDQECGTIKSMTLYNFMCHKYFKIEFGPRINFIIGKNGSGKSAVLTAIVLVLGARASKTSRGHTISSFVKKGETKARVIIELCNYNGCDKSSSYKYEEYGESITVERTISINSDSSYSLKSACGRTVTSKKSELDDIVRHFNIQIDNPICVLNQEVSRNFLNSKNPQDKYDFFMKATQLENIRNEYALAQEKSRLTSIEMENLQNILEEIKKEVKELASKIELFNKLDNQSKQLETMKSEYRWALVIEKETIGEQLETELAKKRKQLIGVKDEIDDLNRQITELGNEKNQQGDILKQAANEMEEINTQLNEHQARLREYRTKKHNFSLEINNCKSTQKRLIYDEKVMIDKIEQLKKQYGDEESREREKRARLDKIDQLEQENESFKAEVKTTQLKKQTLQSSISKINEQIQEVKDETRNLREQMERKRNELRNLRSNDSSELQRFGAHIPELLRQIDVEYERGRFRKKPLGPIGYKIKLKDPDAALAVESCLKATIHSFVCDNGEDQRHLQSLMSKVMSGGRWPTIITREFRSRHNVSSRKIQSGRYRSILELLEIVDDPIANALIDHHMIETIAFIPDEREARDVLINESRVPYNCNQAFTAQGTQMYPRKNGQYFKSYACYLKQARFLSRSLSHYINDMEDEIQQLSGDFKVKTARIEPLNQTLMSNRADLGTIDVKLRELMSKIQNNENELIDLRNVQEPTSLEIVTLEDELKKFSENKDEIEIKMNELNEKIVMCEEKIARIEKDINSFERQKKEKMERQGSLKYKFSRIDEEISSRESRLLKQNATMRNLDESIEDCVQKLDVVRSEIGELKAKASEESGEHGETHRSRLVIKNEVNEIRNFLAEQAKEIGANKKETYEKYEEKKNKYEETSNQIDRMQEYLNDFMKSTKIRLQNYNNLKIRITNQACSVFKAALETLNFSGTLNVYHEDQRVDGQLKKGKTLEIKINPKANNNNCELYNDTRSLSGGERSYTTVAFLIALWESCNSPFRILDEVDVFMDMITRSIAIQILIANAKMKTGKQYIFLSPLGLATEEDLIRVHRMPEPVRSNVTQPGDDE